MPLFKFLLPTNSRHKEHLTPTEVDADTFIRNLKKRGHREGMKDGSAIVGATLKPNGRLELKDVETVTALILDIDGKFGRGKDTRHEVIDPESIFNRLPFRGVAHTSYSHTPELPKFRIILPLLEPVSPGEHHRIWWWLYEKLDKKIDASAKDASRLFFLPRYAAGSDASLHWIKELAGPFLSSKDVPAEYQIPELYEAPRRKQGAHSAPPSRGPSLDAHSLIQKLLSLPIYCWAIENPSEVSREVWRGLAVNLATAVLEDDSVVDEARQAFHELSSPDEDRYNEYVTNKTFTDALKSAAQVGPMTYATMMLNGAPEEICTSMAMDFKAPIAQARHLVKDDLFPKTEAPVAKLQPVTGAPSVTTQAVSTSPTKTEEESDSDNTEEDSYINHPPSDFLHDMSDDKFYALDKKANGWVGPFGPGALSQQLLSWGLPRTKQDSFRAQIISYSHREPIFTSDAQLVKTNSFPIFNTYRRPNLVVKAGNWDDVHAVLFNLVNGDQSALDYTLDWYALPIQHLYALKSDGTLSLNQGSYKMGTSLVYHGDQGSGKGTLERILAVIYGSENIATIGQEALDGRFNGILTDKLFVIANEVMSSTNRSAATANKIKPWITDSIIPVEDKFRSATQVKNHFNIIFTSNDERPVIIEKTDRRFSVFKTGPRLGQNITDRIYADIEGAQTQVMAFLHALLTRKCSLKYGELYKTNARDEMIKLSGPSDEKFLEQVVDDGWFAVAAPWVELGTDQHPREFTVNENIVLNDTLNEVYQFWCRKHGVKARNVAQLGKTIKSVVPTAEATRVRHGGAQRRGWKYLPMGVLDETPQHVVEKASSNSDDADFT